MEKHLEITLLANTRKKEREYWLAQLAGELNPSTFPRTVPKHKVDATQISIPFTITDPLFTLLMNLSKGADQALYVILVAAVSALLKRYTGNPDIILGAPIFRQEEENLINRVLILRQFLQDELSFKAILVQTRKIFLEAVEHQNYPIETLYDQLDLVGSTEGARGFDVAVYLENLHDPAYLASARPNVVFGFTRTDSALEGRLEYNSAFFSKAMMERIPGHLTNYLQQVLQNPGLPLHEIDFLTGVERHKLLVEFNDTAMDTPTHKTLHQLLEERVALHPDKEAVAMWSDSLTFAELDAYANQLANYLIEEQGLQHEARVGVLIDKSLEWIIAFFGILKAGCVYVPMHRSYPEKKIIEILEDAEISVMLASRGYSEMLERLQGEVGAFRSILYMEGLAAQQPGEELPRSCKEGREELTQHDSRVVLGYPTTHPAREVKSTNMAYIIFTSGTTGKPKGVMLEHKGVSNMLISYHLTMGIYETDRVGQFQRCTFDASIAEIVRSLLIGATLVLIPEEVIGSYTELEHYINDQQITAVTMPPNYLTYVNPDNIHSLRLVITGGAETNFELINKWRRKNVEYANGYGPTEFSITSSIWKVPAGELLYDSVPIGKPNANTKVYIVDEYFNLQPVGVPGELCIAGVGLARGYLNRPELTAEKFVANPFEPGTKMYRTGDLASWFEDGNIRFHGRNDDQVKIRGFRIELGEIKSRLLVYPGIQDAAVVARKDGDGEKYLCAYYVAAEEIPVATFRTYLLEQLPDYMVPGYYIRLAQLPLTLHGKLDTRALPAPEIQPAAVALVPPGNELQIKLVKVWADILKLEEVQIGICNDFFELGGHSLKATQLVVRLEQEFGVRLQLAEIFQLGTIEQLAQRIEQVSAERYAAIPVAERREVYPLAAAQQRFMQLTIDGGERIGTMLNKWEARYVEGKLDLERLEAAFQALIRRHESLRTSFGLRDGEPVQVIHEQVDFHLERYKANDKASVEQIVESFIRPFDLTKAPLLRAGVIELEHDLSVVLFDRHLIIADGVSMGILVRDLMALYAGEELPELRIQFKDYAVWQQAFLQRADVVQQEKYWREQLQAMRSARLPLDYAEPEEATYAAEQVRMLLPRALTDQLQQLATGERATMYMVLLAIYNAVLAAQFDQEEIVVATPVAGRQHQDLQQQIGMFINTLAMRNQPVRAKTFVEFLAEVRDQALKAFENQDYPLQTWFPIGFALHNMETVATRFGNLTFSPYRLDKKNTLSHLHLTAIEGDEGIQLIFEFRPELYECGTVESVARKFLHTAESVAHEPTIQLSGLKALQV